MKPLSTYVSEPLTLDESSALGRRVHLFEQDDVDAVETAIRARRPLLLMGEPGVGKSQLAEAVAVYLRRPFVPKVIDARTEARDLFFTVDFVKRLSEAQIQRTPVSDSPVGPEKADPLALSRFSRPGPLWWAFSWKTAKTCRLALPPGDRQDDECRAGVVVLIDEIDKAEADVPNGLLVALGDSWFEGPEGERISLSKEQAAPVVILTSNRDRDLPDAFLRRCVVHTMQVPKNAEAFFVRRAQAVFGSSLNKETILEAASWIVADRLEAERRQEHKPGLAEYLDLLRVVVTNENSSDKPASLQEQQRRMATARRYIFRKFAGPEMKDDNS